MNLLQSEISTIGPWYLMTEEGTPATEVTSITRGNMTAFHLAVFE
jgi:hypothetical protein